MNHVIGLLSEKDPNADIPLKKQPSRCVLKETCFENMQQIYRKTLMPKLEFYKVPLQLY